MSALLWSLTALWTALLWLFAGVGALLLLFLVVPITLRVEGEAIGLQAWGRVRAGWGFGLLLFELSSVHGARVRVAGWWRRVGETTGTAPDRARGAVAVAAPAARSQKPSARRASRRRGPSPGFWWAHRGALAELAKRALRALGLRGALRLRIGLRDPAATAQLGSCLGLVFGALPLHATVELDWMEPCLEVEGRLRARVWGLALLGALVATLWSGRTRRLLWEAWRSGRPRRVPASARAGGGA